MSSKERTDDIILQHEEKGYYTILDGVRTFALDTGVGPVVFCIHGVPTCSFLYRKVAQELEKLGLRTIAIDLPGLGLSGRPENFDYTFSNLGRFCNSFLDALNISEVHLLTHDIGTPVGLSMAMKNSRRVKSITILNSMLDLENFKKPLPMRPFETPLLGEAELALLTPFTFSLFMKAAGVLNIDCISQEEMAAYIHFLKREDGGKAFLKIMRNFEQTTEFTQTCYHAFQNPEYPVQLIWGSEDPLLPYIESGKDFEKARPGIPVTKVKAKHFLQEEQYVIIASKVKGLMPNIY